MKRTALTSRSELKAFRDAWDADGSGKTAAAYLAGNDEGMERKIQALMLLA